MCGRFDLWTNPEQVDSRGPMTEERTALTVGQPIGSTPPKEGYMPILNGPSFDILAFYTDIS